MRIFDRLKRRQEGEAQTVVDDGLPVKRFKKRRIEQIGPETQTVVEPVYQPCMEIVLSPYPETVDVTIRHDVDMQVEAGNALYQSGGKITVPVGREGIVLGRSRQADIQVLEEHVSRVHARLAFRKGYLEVKDLGSSNGTLILVPYQHLSSGERGPLSRSSRLRLGRHGPDLDISYK